MQCLIFALISQRLGVDARGREVHWIHTPANGIPVELTTAGLQWRCEELRIPFAGGSLAGRHRVTVGAQVYEFQVN